MPVDAELQPILALMNSGPPLREVPLEQLRQFTPAPAGPPVPLESVTDRTLPTAAGELPVRIYAPRAATGLPVLVYFHGGGFVLGSLDSHDGVARRLALDADCIVVSVDYRLAPEHRFPAAADDALHAVRWVLEHAGEVGGDARRVVVGGDSAGANLAAVSVLRLREGGAALPRGQLLIYPVTHLRSPLEGSMLENGDGYFLRAIDMQWFEDMYLQSPADAAHPHASPLLAKDLRGLPSAFVLTAEFDPLRDQGAAYAARLAAAGVPCVHSDYPGAFHGFFGMPVGISQRAVAEACGWLKAAFADTRS